jgi:hypothetical protein
VRCFSLCRSARALSCVDHVLSMHGDAETAVFVAVDDPAVREIARQRYSPTRPFFAASFHPRHIAWQTYGGRNATDEIIAESYESTAIDYYSLMQCAYKTVSAEKKCRDHYMHHCHLQASTSSCQSTQVLVVRRRFLVLQSRGGLKMKHWCVHVLYWRY